MRLNFQYILHLEWPGGKHNREAAVAAEKTRKARLIGKRAAFSVWFPEGKAASAGHDIPLHRTEGLSDQLMIKSTIDLAHATGMSVVAEGVETEHAMALLKVMGADTAQGYFISKPQPLAKMLDFLNAGADQRERA